MKNQRSCFTLINDPKSKLSFKMLTHVPDLPTEYWTASWGDLHELRSKVTKGLQHILDIAERG